MAKTVLTNVRLFTGGADLTGNTNKVEFSSETEEKDTTNFNSGGWREVIAGLYSTDIAEGGQWEAGDASKPDDATWAQLGSAVQPWSACPVGGAVGDLAYLTRAFRSSYSAVEGSIGDVAGWTGKVKSSWPMVRGVVAHPSGTARTASGTGTSIQLGTIASTKYLYAALHVLSVSGTASPTITVRIESDDNSGFTSATTRATFAAATATGGEVIRVAGPGGSDDYWRAAWTISGTNPSFLFVVTFGMR